MADAPRPPRIPRNRDDDYTAEMAAEDPTRRASLPSVGEVRAPRPAGGLSPARRCMNG